VCTGQPFTSVADATAAVRAGLAFLNDADAASIPVADQAECLRELARAESAATSAQARMLAVFSSQGGYSDDGQGSARSWLTWQTRITGGAAAAAMGWMKRLLAHPSVGQALAKAAISASWARAICAWTDQLPEDSRGEADTILLAAAAGGATLADLAGLAEEMRRRAAGPDEGGDHGFDDRSLWLGLTFAGAGRLTGDLTPACAAALSAVLEALGKKTGPEDGRSLAQRRHDALEEACRRLVAAGGLPGRAGQPTQILLHLTLDQLRGLPGAADAEQAWDQARAAAEGEPGWLRGAETAGAYACDAQITPIVTGHVDPEALGKMTAEFLDHPRAARSRRRLQDTLLRYAADVLSGPAGLAAFLRTGLLGKDFPAAISLPLDVGAATSTVPAHLRRAVIARDRHCSYPGCGQRPSACQVHHITPRSQGGVTSLANLVLLCTFHHLIAVHQWGWSISLNADGAITATSPDGTRILRSHSPPRLAA
jgi:Domain of unknown function (DUF222)/HNH endonuclease